MFARKLRLPSRHHVSFCRRRLVSDFLPAEARAAAYENGASRGTGRLSGLLFRGKSRLLGWRWSFYLMGTVGLATRTVKLIRVTWQPRMAALLATRRPKLRQRCGMGGTG
jgi:hypothetical protein